MPTNTLTAAQLKGAGIFNGFVIPASGGGSPFTNTYSLTFDGSLDYLSGASTFSELDGQNKATFSMWVKWDNFSTYKILFNIARDTTQSNMVATLTATNTGGLRFHIFSSARYLYSNTGILTPNTWHHIMVCVDLTDVLVANRGIIFVDGVNQTASGFSQLNETIFPTSNSPLYVGEDKNSWYNPHLGQIDEFAMWVGTDQRANVSDIYNGGVPFDLSTLATAPDHWWRMGDGDTFSTEWTINDNIGSYNLTSVSMPEAARLPISPNSYTQNSFNFNFNSYFNLATKTQNFTDFSLSFWILSRGGSNKTIFANDSLTVANGGGILANIQDSAYRVRYFDDSTGYTNLSDTLIGSVWNHIVITYQSSTNELKGYTNNVLFTTLNPTITTFTNNSHSFDKIGYSVGSNYTGANLDEISVFDSVLNPTQISQIFGIGTPNDISSLSPVHHWRMGENATWNGSVWTITDIGSSPITLTSNGMTEAYKTGDQPYVL